MATRSGAAATWWCEACRQTGRGERFRRTHEQCGPLEERTFTAVTGAPPPSTLDEVMAELEAAKFSDELRVPDIAFVQQMLKPLRAIDFRHMTEETPVPTHVEAEKMFRARQLYPDGGASGLTEQEAAIFAYCIEHKVSAAARQDLCNLFAHRGHIARGFAAKMDQTEGALGLVPGWQTVSLSTGVRDIEDFGPLTFLFRDVICVMWSILCNPAID